MAEAFRKSALEKLSSPEQLDKAITVSSPASWLALIGVTIIVIATLSWAAFGTLPTTMQAQGISVSSGGDISNGQTVECYVPFSEAGQIKNEMKAIVYNSADGSRYDAKVTNIDYGDTVLSDMELVLGGNEITVKVSLQLASGKLSERTLVTAKIITDEAAPLSKLFK